MDAELSQIFSKAISIYREEVGNYGADQMRAFLDALPAEQPRVPDRETLAAYAHDAWAHWMKYMLGCGFESLGGEFVLPLDKVKRWQRQMNTPYEELPEEEKESDRRQADLILAIIAP